MQLIHVIVWRYRGGGGFDWYRDKKMADSYFEDEKEVADDYVDERWVVKQTTLMVPDYLVGDRITEHLEPKQDELFINALKIYPVEAYQVKEVYNNEEFIIKYNPIEFIKLYESFELATCQELSKGKNHGNWERVSPNTFNPEAPTVHTIYGRSKNGLGVTALFDLDTVATCRKYAGQLQADTGLPNSLDALVATNVVLNKIAKKVIKNITGVKRRK